MVFSRKLIALTSRAWPHKQAKRKQKKKASPWKKTRTGTKKIDAVPARKGNGTNTPWKTVPLSLETKPYQEHVYLSMVLYIYIHSKKRREKKLKVCIYEQERTQKKHKKKEKKTCIYEQGQTQQKNRKKKKAKKHNK